MNFYLVGGAVRDKLLNYEVLERDWVVVGGSPEQMITQGFKQVGKDFPVFLHPETKEEYALARTERKQGHGYSGFAIDASDITLEQDLLRRDLTINAMAMDVNGEVIDPFGGQQDLKDKLLRHVSNAFSEDPVRLLRVARFAARYHHLGFSVAPETMLLMKNMVNSGEVDYLVAERVFKEFVRSLKERNPQVFIRVLRQCGALKRIMPELDVLFGVPNPPQHHPEIDSGVHSLMVLEAACRLSDDVDVRFAALIHDLGKGITPMNQWPSHKGHDNLGIEVIERFCHRLGVTNVMRDLAVKASKFHILIHKYKELKASTRVKLLQQADAYRNEAGFKRLLMVCEADARGRLNTQDEPYKQAKRWWYLLQQLKAVDVQAIIEQGYSGQQIKNKLHQQRVSVAKQLEQHET